MIYVCSDIHGRFDRYKKLLKKIKDDDTLYILGDAIDRGQDGIKILKDIMNRKNVILISGNHEDFMYKYLLKQQQLSIQNNKKSNIFNNDNNDFNTIWFADANGGKITYDKFLEEPENIQLDIFNFLSKLPVIVLLKINDTKFHLSHAGTILNKNFNRYKLNKPTIIYRHKVSDNDIYHILWCNPYKYSSYLDFSEFPNNFTCIFGHVPVQVIKDDFIKFKPYKYNNTIDIDGGCAYILAESKYPDDVKTALNYMCLDTMKSYYIR